MEKEIILKEKFEGGLKHALYSNFSNYTEAILELLDNSVSNRIIGKKLIINILISKKNLTIIDKVGYGMDIKELQEFLEWGKIKSRKSYDIGAYSQGGKSAMGYLGKTMIVITSPKGKKIQHRIENNNLLDYELKEYLVMEIPTDFNEGATQIEIGGLKRAIKDDVLKKVIVDTYRPLIEKGEIIMKYNGEILKEILFPLDNFFKKEKFSFYIDKKEKLVNGWIGRLISKSGVKGGIRCYKLGRLICDKEFFSRYDATYKQTLNYLFGEVYLDFVPATTNKTDFDRDSQEWIKIKEAMFKILKPHIDELLGKEIKEPSDEEKNRVKQTRDIVAELMKMRNKELEGSKIEGESFGQKPSEAKDNDLKKIKSTTHTRDKYQPKTPPPKDAKGKRRRLKEFMDWEIRPMDELIRSVIELKNDHKILVINNLFSGYIAAKGHQLYLIETATLQLSTPNDDEKITPQEYLKNFDELYSYFCGNIEFVKKRLKKKKIEI